MGIHTQQPGSELTPRAITLCSCALGPILERGPQGPHMASALHSSCIIKERANGQKGGADNQGSFESSFERGIRSGIPGGRSHWQRFQGRQSHHGSQTS